VFRRHKKTTTTTVIRDGSRLMTAAAAAASGDERPDEHATSQSRNLQPPRPIRPPPTTTADARPWSLQHLLYTTTDELRSGRALSVAHSLLTHCSHSTRSIGSMKRSSVRPFARPSACSVCPSCGVRRVCCGQEMSIDIGGCRATNGAQQQMRAVSR